MFYFASNKFNSMRILFSSSFVNQSHNGAAIFAQLFLKWAQRYKHHVDVISIEKNEGFIEVLEPSIKTPIHFQRKLSKAIYQKIKSLNYNSYDLIFFNNIIEAEFTVKNRIHNNVQGFLHDSQYMNDVYPHQSFRRKLFRMILKNIEKRTINKLNKVHTNSEQMKAQIHKFYKTPLNKLSYFYFSSLDLHPKVKMKNSEFSILFVKTNYISGGLITLLNACKTLSFPNKIIAIGPPKEAQKELKNQFPNQSIEFHSYKRRNEIGHLFSQADVFITPAFTEPMGIGNMEAMKMDIPVIGNNLEGVKEIAEISKAILLFEKNNAIDLALKITTLKDDEKLKRNLVINGRKFVEDYLSEDVIFENFQKAIN